MLSGGRLDAGLGPGSSEADYRLAGIPFAERWTRFDDAVGAMRALWDADAPPFVGRFYDTSGVGRLLPPPAQPTGPPIWVGSWGSTAGLRRVARLGDGWLASGYNTTPESFATELADARRHARGGRAAIRPTFRSTMATTWLFVTDRRDRTARAVYERLSQMLRRPIEAIRGPAADRLHAGGLPGPHRVGYAGCRPSARPGVADARTRSSSSSVSQPRSSRDRCASATSMTRSDSDRTARMHRTDDRPCGVHGVQFDQAK